MKFILLCKFLGDEIAVVRKLVLKLSLLFCVSSFEMFKCFLHVAPACKKHCVDIVCVQGLCNFVWCLRWLQ